MYTIRVRVSERAREHVDEKRSVPTALDFDRVLYCFELQLFQSERFTLHLRRINITVNHK